MSPRSHYKEGFAAISICREPPQKRYSLPRMCLFGRIHKGLVHFCSMWDNLTRHTCWICQHFEPIWIPFNSTLCSSPFLLLVSITNKTLLQGLLLEHPNFDRSLTLLTRSCLNNYYKDGIPLHCFWGLLRLQGPRSPTSLCCHRVPRHPMNLVLTEARILSSNLGAPTQKLWSS